MFGNFVTHVMREPVGVSSNVNNISIEGIDSSGLPLASEKPSSTSNERPWSIERKCHHPPAVSPSGPDITYSERPPGFMSCFENFAGHVSGPQNFSSCRGSSYAFQRRSTGTGYSPTTVTVSSSGLDEIDLIGTAHSLCSGSV